MAARVVDVLQASLTELRWHPVPTRIRASRNGVTIVDSTRVLLVWEPRRIVPQYAVPEADLDADLEPAEDAPAASDWPVLSPEVGFAAHTADGEPLTVRLADESIAGSAFRPGDHDLAGHVVLDFGAFDWLEEDEVLVSHARDPFSRIDIRPSSRRVRFEHQGQVLADSASPTYLIETGLPVRYYLPAGDVRTELLQRSATRTTCAYKGEASHLALAGGDGRDLAWSYPTPLPEVARIAGLMAFYTERVDMFLDDQPVERPRTYWS